MFPPHGQRQSEGSLPDTPLVLTFAFSHSGPERAQRFQPLSAVSLSSSTLLLCASRASASPQGAVRPLVAMLVVSVLLAAVLVGSVSATVG